MGRNPDGSDVASIVEIPTLVSKASLPRTANLKFERSGLNQAIATGIDYNILQLLFNNGSIISGVLTTGYGMALGSNPENIKTAGTTASVVLKAPVLDVDSYALNINIRLTGSVGGSTSTQRTFDLNYQRATGELIDNKTIIKYSTSSLSSEGNFYPSWVSGAADKLITDGFKFILKNTSGQTVTLTSVVVTIEVVK